MRAWKPGLVALASSVLACAHREQRSWPAGEPSSWLGVFGAWGCGFCPVTMTTVLAFQKFSWEREHVLDIPTEK